ncbi:MAG: site-specific integrase [Verrucomicrobiae bacterium]|nr:site-specific integrase [Verrucomicrobiae bacterium]
MVVSLFNFARQQRYVARDFADEIAEIPAPKLEVVAAGIFTPDDMAKLLASAEESDQVLLAFGAFAGLRTAELHRLDWKDVPLSERAVVVGADKAKTASRRVIPISDNLVEWIIPSAQPARQISRYSHEYTLSWGLMKVAHGAGLKSGAATSWPHSHP